MEKFQNFITKYKIIEILLFSIAFIFGTYFTFNNGVQDLVWYDWVLWFDIVIGIIAAVALAKKWKYSWLLLIFDGMLYGSALFGQGIYATGVINAVIAPIILLLSLITWKNHQEKDSNLIETRKLNLKEGIILTLVAIFSTMLIGNILNYFLPPSSSIVWVSWMDAFISVLMLFAFAFSVLRYREAWYLFLLSNFIKIIMFSALLIFYKEENTSPLSLILAITYFLNGLYALWIWNSSKKESLFKSKPKTNQL